MRNLEHIFIQTAADQARDLGNELDEPDYDVVVGDSLSLGAGLAAELRRVRWATISALPNGLPSVDLPPPGLRSRPPGGPLVRARNRLLWNVFHVTTGRLERAHREARRELGLPSSGRRIDDAWYSPELVPQTGTPELKYPRSDLPESAHFVWRLGNPAVVTGDLVEVSTPLRCRPGCW